MFAYSNRIQIQTFQAHSKAHQNDVMGCKFDYIRIAYLIRNHFSCFFSLKLHKLFD